MANLRVNGYTRSKCPVEVSMPIEQIVAKGIDPWRCDLFGAEPVAIAGQQEELLFTHLRDLCFAYWENEGGRMYVGVHDGVNPVCFWFKHQPEPLSEWSISLTDPTASERPFAEHFAEYLNLIARGGLRYSSPCGVGCINQYLVYVPRSRKSLLVHGDTIKLTSLNDLEHTAQQGLYQTLVHCGEMFSEVHAPLKLPPVIDWVFQTLSEWQPIVYGPALRKSLHQMPVQEVHFMIPKNELDGLKTQLASQFDIELADPRYYQRGDWIIDCGTFEYNRCTYHIRDTPRQSLIDGFRSEDRYSADCLYSLERDIVSASRIALFDATTFMARRIGRPEFDNIGDHIRVEHKQLEEDGYKIVFPTPVLLAQEGSIKATELSTAP